MAVQVLIKDRKHYTTWANDTDYLSNTSEFNTYLRGGVGNRQKVVYTVEVSWSDRVQPNSGDEWDLDANSLTRKLGSWIDEGFSIGDSVQIYIDHPTNTFFEVRNITNITDNIIFFDGTAVPIAERNSTQIGSVIGQNLQDGIEYSFGIIPNEDEPFFNSLLDNSNQTYYANDIGTSFVNMQPKSNAIQGWDSSRTGETRVKRTTTTPGDVQEFVIEHEYIINPYNDDALLDGNKSLKYVSQFSFRSSLAANINSAKTAIDSLQLGSVGYYNENYDGYNNDFSISNLVYEDTSSNTQTSLNIKGSTRVTFNVNSNNAIFTNTTPIVVTHSYLPDFNTYNKSADSYIDTWVYDLNRMTSTGSNKIGTTINQLSSTVVNANQLLVSCIISFDTNQQSRLEEGYNYVLSCEVGSNLDGRDNVTLKVDENTYLSENNITGLIVSNEFGFNAYDKFIAPKENLHTTYSGWVADEIVSYHRFGVNRTASKDAEILNGYFKLVAYNDVTGTYFELQNEQIDLSEQFTAPIGVIDNSTFTVQYIKDERTRGYNLPNGDEFNLLLFEAKDNDATYQYYEYRVGFKMNWQDWIALPGADAIFIDTTKDFNGLNNNASNYNLNNDYSIRVLWEFEMQGLDSDGNTGTTTYNFYSSAFDIYDFGNQDNDPTIWTTELFTFDEDGNNLNGKVSTDQKTLVRTIFTPTAPYIIDSNIPWWAEYRIAEQNQTGFNNDVITTTKNYSQNNRLIPKDGETHVTLDIDSNTIITECLVDNTKLISGRDYKIDSYLRNSNEPVEPITWTFETETNITLEDFDGNFVASNGEFVTWTLKNGTTYSATNSLNIPTGTTLNGDELNGVCQDVVISFSTNNPANINTINLGNTLQNANVCGNVDLTVFSNLTNITFNESNIDSITFSSDQQVNINEIFLNLIPNITTIDYSPLGGFFGGNIQARECVNLLSIEFPNSTNEISQLGFGNTNTNKGSLATITNLIGLTGLGTTSGAGADVEFEYNNLSGSLVLPNSPNNIRSINVRNNSLTSLDLSGLSGFNGLLEAVFNDLTSISFNANTRFGVGVTSTSGCKLSLNDLTFVDFSVITANNNSATFNLNNNKISASNMQTILNDLDATGWTNCTFYAPNQSPALTAGEISTIQGTSQYSSLIGKGWTITL